MKTSILTITALFATLFAFQSCTKDDTKEVDKFEYHAHVMSPDDSNKHMGDTLKINVHFESHTGETVHNINVTIKEATTGTVVYNKPDDSHVHGMSGEYMYSDNVELNTANGFKGHTDYILEAKVWGDSPGLSEEIETVEFHVHP